MRVIYAVRSICSIGVGHAVSSLGLLAGLGLLCGAPAARADEPARVIVKLKSSSSLLQVAGESVAAGGASGGSSRMSRLGLRAGVRVSEARQIGARLHVATASGMSSQALAAKLAQQSDVEYAVVDQRRQRTSLVPNDPRYPSGQSSPYPAAGQWYAQSSDSTIVSAINAPTAWGLSTGSASVVVAVLDTGVRFDHVDLANKLLPGYNFISDASMAGNGTGRSSDASDLGDWLTSAEISANPSVFSGCTAQASSSWHGTQVAGLIAADTNNGVGVAGVGWDVKILPVRVLGKCGGYDSDIIAGMRWAAGLSVSGAPSNSNPAQVINLSLGSSGSCSQAYLDAVNEVAAAGALVVAAAGNEALDVISPANCNGVLAVAALRHTGTKVGYSSLGPSVGISAPGGNCVNTSGACIYPMVSTTNSGTTTPVADASGGSVYTDATNYAVGTSFATPLVSATAALMKSVNTSLTPAQLAGAIKASSRAFPATGGTSGIGSYTVPGSATQDECYCTAATCGAGMLDAGSAVAAVSTLQAVITANPGVPTPGSAVTLSATDTIVPSGDSIASYAWTLVDGGGIVTTLSSATGSSVSATPSASGTFRVQLVVTTASSATSTVIVSITASSRSSSASTSAASVGNGSGGGGAVDAALLLGLTAALGALAVSLSKGGVCV